MSLLRHLYYELKPYTPVSIRLALRRTLAGRMLARSRDVWPIKRATAHAPSNWPGWPGGKKFALVLTHDVERLGGLQKVEQLARVEMDLGFRSSFNFIPEGDYDTPQPLRDRLVQSGFEIGVHDLRHDGKLYRSHAEFSLQANKINQHLRSWNAVGFRSGFMHHNLDWLGELDIEYDMSTFDTDPFEPQPDGVDTIFPFWVPRQNSIRNQKSEIKNRSQGFVELPYTLPQDSTLFLFLEQDNIDTWKSKLDWIAQHGGMALVNVHPDYINFENQHTSTEYPVTFYRDFLRYAADKYKNQYWSALPREVARYIREFEPQPRPLSSKRVCMVSYSFYASDNRVMRYAEALVERGDSVDVIALRGENRPKNFEVIDGVNVFRAQKRLRNEKGKAAYLLRLLRFLLVAGVRLGFRHLRRPYDVIHVHNIPDFLVFSALLPKLLGARVLLDIHDILPEFFSSKFSAADSSWYVHNLYKIERASCAFADHVIIANHIWHKKITQRSVPLQKCSVVLNHVDPHIFYSRPRTRTDNKKIAIFPGGLQNHQGLDVAIRAFVEVVKSVPTAEFHIYGDGNMKESWVNLARELHLENHVFFFEPLSIREIAEKIANADVGVVPKRADSFGNEAYSTKIMEFMSQGLPVVASRTMIDSYYFDDSTIRFFESGNSGELAHHLIDLFLHPEHARELVQNGLAYVAENNWDGKKHEYYAIVDGLPLPPALKCESIPAKNDCREPVSV